MTKPRRAAHMIWTCWAILVLLAAAQSTTYSGLTARQLDLVQQRLSEGSSLRQAAFPAFVTPELSKPSAGSWA